MEQHSSGILIIVPKNKAIYKQMTDNPYINAQGHRERIKFILRRKEKMSDQGWNLWSRKIQPKLTRVVSKFVGSHKDCIKTWNDADEYGVPAELFATRRSTINFLLSEFCLAENVTYTLNGFSKKRTVTHVGFSKTWMRFKITNLEQGTFEVWDDATMNRYWFRKNVKQDE